MVLDSSTTGDVSALFFTIYGYECYDVGELYSYLFYGCYLPYHVRISNRASVKISVDLKPRDKSQLAVGYVPRVPQVRIPL